MMVPEKSAVALSITFTGLEPIMSTNAKSEISLTAREKGRQKYLGRFRWICEDASGEWTAMNLPLSYKEGFKVAQSYCRCH